MMAEISRKLKKIELSLKANNDDTMIRACGSYLCYLDAGAGSKEELAAYQEWTRLDPCRFAETLVERIAETGEHSADNNDIQNMVDWATEGAAKGVA